MEYILIFIAAVFVNNVVLSQFLGICPFLGVSKKVDTAIGMGAAVAFVLTIATLVTFLVQKYVLDVFGLGFMQTISFILIIAALVQMVEIILKKVSPALYQALGVFLPLITTNCCVLGVAIQVIQKQYNLLESVVYAFSIAIGFASPRIDIRLGDLYLFTCKAYAQPAVLIEIRRRLQLATDNGSQCATHLRRFHPFGQNMHQSSLS